MKRLGLTPVFRSHAAHRYGDNNLVAMINIVFLLLVFFLVSGSIRNPDPVQLQLPASDANDQANTDVVQVHIGPQGNVWLYDEPVRLVNLGQALRAIGSDSGYRVQLRADKQAPVAVLTRILSEAQAAGASHISVLTRLR